MKSYINMGCDLSINFRNIIFVFKKNLNVGLGNILNIPYKK